MKEFKLQKILGTVIIAIVIGSAIANNYVHESKNHWLIFVCGSSLFGVCIGIIGYGWVLRRWK